MDRLVLRWALWVRGDAVSTVRGEQFHTTEDRGRVLQIQPTAKNARNHSQCDSMLIGDTAGANTYPYIQVSHRADPDILIYLFGRHIEY